MPARAGCVLSAKRPSAPYPSSPQLDTQKLHRHPALTGQVIVQEAYRCTSTPGKRCWRRCPAHHTGTTMSMLISASIAAHFLGNGNPWLSIDSVTGERQNGLLVWKCPRSRLNSLKYRLRRITLIPFRSFIFWLPIWPGLYGQPGLFDQALACKLQAIEVSQALAEWSC